MFGGIMYSFCPRAALRLALAALLIGASVCPSYAVNGAAGAGNGNGGPGAGSTGPGGGSSAGGGGHSTVGPTGSSGPSVKSVSDSAEQAVTVCDAHTARCIADALDDYATALRALGPLLPREFNDLPVIVERAATKVRTARTKKEAISAVQSAIAEVHKRIALLRADDPVTLKVGTRDGAFVIQTLQVADDKLEKAVGL
jgi:hypothetical protein